jgi:hypothetical protein
MAKLFSNQRLKAVGRLLNDEEMEQVFGGYGIADEGLDQFLGAYGQPADDDDDDDEDIVVTGDPGGEHEDENEDYGDDDDDSEDGGGDIVVVGEQPLPPEIQLRPDPDLENDGDIVVVGDQCPTARIEAAQALSQLAQGSPIMRAIIESAGEHYVVLDLLRTAESAYFNSGTMQISWDPFLAFEFENTDGSRGYIAPALALAHELLHWAMPGASELQVIAMANLVAAQLNQFYGTNFATNRDQHGGYNGSFLVTDTMAPSHDSFTLSRPGCH